MRRVAPLSFSFLLLAACGKVPEGQNPGECADGADNDGNGAFDCDDAGCSGSPDCASVDDTGPSENAAPSGAAIAITPATPGDDDDLACTIVTEATDPNGDAVTYRYAWTVNGGDAGITGANVTADRTSGGDTWTCTVTPSDGRLDGTPATASVTVAQGNRPPSAPTVSITPAAPTDNDTLTCRIDTESVDPDGDAVTYTYAWSVDGADTGLTGKTLGADATEAGQQWTCTAIASDGALETQSSSTSVEILPAESVLLSTGKTASQSSTYNNGSRDFLARYGTDGIYDADCAGASGGTSSCVLASTKVEPDAWWQVDLGARYSVEQVVVWPRPDMYIGDCGSFDILTSTDGSTWSTFDSESGTLATPTTYAGHAPARYVRIQRNDGRELVTVEVEVFGY